jgi:hypothetical protein
MPRPKYKIGDQFYHASGTAFITIIGISNVVNTRSGKFSYFCEIRRIGEAKVAHIVQDTMHLDRLEVFIHNYIPPRRYFTVRIGTSIKRVIARTKYAAVIRGVQGFNHGTVLGIRQHIRFADNLWSFQGLPITVTAGEEVTTNPDYLRTRSGRVSSTGPNRSAEPRSEEGVLHE